MIQLAQRRVLVRHQRHLARLTAHGLHQEIAFPVDGTEALVLDFEQLIGRARGFQAVAEVRAEHAQLLPLGEFRVTPEQAFYLSPGKEIGMDNLVGIAAQQKITRLLECLEHQCKLNGSEILHFIDHDKIVTRRGEGLPFLRDEVEVIELCFSEPRTVFFE